MTKTLTRTPHTKTPSRRVLPASWARAAGLLRGHKRSLTSHAKRVRADWSR